MMVSTHSRPKAAGLTAYRLVVCCLGFNTQPPEGGWLHILSPIHRMTGFNTQPPEGGWDR